MCSELRFETTNDGDPTDWNAASKEQIVWDSASLSDGTYGQSGESITVKQAGDYLLVYNDLLQSICHSPKSAHHRGSQW